MSDGIERGQATPEADRKANPAQAWTIKGMDPQHREAITAAAHRAEVSVAQWVWEACSARIRADRQANQPGGAEGEVLPSQANPQANHIETLVALLREARELATTQPVQGAESLVRTARAALRRTLCAAFPVRRRGVPEIEGPRRP